MPEKGYIVKTVIDYENKKQNIIDSVCHEIVGSFVMLWFSSLQQKCKKIVLFLCLNVSCFFSQKEIFLAKAISYPIETTWQKPSKKCLSDSD